MKINVFLFILLLVITSSCDTISQLLLKNAINSLGIDVSGLKKIFRFILRLVLIPWVWTGLIFSCISLFVWLFVLSKVDLNLAFSVDSMHYIFIAFASRSVLKERVGFKRWAGTIFIVLGIVLVSLTGRN